MFPAEKLMDLRKISSDLEGHPTPVSITEVREIPFWFAHPTHVSITEVRKIPFWFAHPTPVSVTEVRKIPFWFAHPTPVSVTEVRKIPFWFGHPTPVSITEMRKIPFWFGHPTPMVLLKWGKYHFDLVTQPLWYYWSEENTILSSWWVVMSDSPGGLSCQILLVGCHVRFSWWTRIAVSSSVILPWYIWHISRSELFKSEEWRKCFYLTMNWCNNASPCTMLVLDRRSGLWFPLIVCVVINHVPNNIKT